MEEAHRILKAYDRTAKPKFGTLRSLICPRVEAQQVCNDISRMLASHLKQPLHLTSGWPLKVIGVIATCGGPKTIGLLTTTSCRAAYQL